MQKIKSEGLDKGIKLQGKSFENNFGNNYITASNFREALCCGYTVDFKHFHRKDEQIRHALRL